jgi:hypothetical protein
MCLATLYWNLAVCFLYSDGFFLELLLFLERVIVWPTLGPSRVIAWS